MSANIAENLNVDAAAHAAQEFVINLCASTSPMALTHPSSPELKRYTFFVSRQREEGRERFRLHMGYFNSQAAAEALLSAVRDVYPAAWAGPAPTSGVPRRPRVVTPAASVVMAAVAAPVAPPPAAVVAAPASTVPDVPALETMSNVRDVLAQLSEQPASTARPAPTPAAAPVSARKPASPPSAAAPAPIAAPPAATPPRTAQPPVVQPPVVQAPVARPPVVQPPVQAAAPAPARPQVAQAPVSPPVAPPVSRADTTRIQPAIRPAASDLNDSQTLRVLEAPPFSAPPISPDGEVRVLTPEDTQTLNDIKLDAQNNAPPCFAVQLVWSATPLDVATLQHLAIFDAYTLYNVEGHRQGHKWFGLRLGFFSDPNSATQVAHYVRSDYPAVAVVPVAVRERDSAKGGSSVKSAPRFPEPGNLPKPETELPLATRDIEGFELIEDDRPVPVKRDLGDAAAETAATPAKPALAAKPVAPAAKPAAPGARTPLASPPPAAKSALPAGKPASGKPTGKRVVMRKRSEPPRMPGAPTPLESTLEILGASTLTLDESREIINDATVRKPIPKKPTNGAGARFARLLGRLGGG